MNEVTFIRRFELEGISQIDVNVESDIEQLFDCHTVCTCILTPISTQSQCGVSAFVHFY